MDVVELIEAQRGVTLAGWRNISREGNTLVVMSQIQDATDDIFVWRVNQNAVIFERRIQAFSE